MLLFRSRLCARARGACVCALRAQGGLVCALRALLSAEQFLDRKFATKGTVHGHAKAANLCILAKIRTGITGRLTADDMEGTALAHSKWTGLDPQLHGRSLWEGEHACSFSRPLAAYGIACWADVIEPSNGKVLQWERMKGKHGVHSQRDQRDYEDLRTQLEKLHDVTTWRATNGETTRTQQTSNVTQGTGRWQYTALHTQHEKLRRVWAQSGNTLLSGQTGLGHGNTQQHSKKTLESNGSDEKWSPESCAR